LREETRHLLLDFSCEGVGSKGQVGSEQLPRSDFLATLGLQFPPPFDIFPPQCWELGDAIMDDWMPSLLSFMFIVPIRRNFV